MEWDRKRTNEWRTDERAFSLKRCFLPFDGGRAGSGDRPNEQTVLVAAVAVALQESSRVRPTGTITKRRSFSLAGQPGACPLGAKGEQRRHRERVGEGKRL